MVEQRIRIGIDVGGTFTDAVAVDGNTNDLIGFVKVQTTHNAPEGVAKGIIDSLLMLMNKHDIRPASVVFIAHGTTQATNALLEGDVCSVGIVGMGRGLESIKAKLDTNVPDVEIAPGKVIRCHHVFVSTNSELTLEQAKSAINTLVQSGAESIVAAGAFSVDEPGDEQQIVEVAANGGYPVCATHTMSKLYGLRVRTRTAVVNASILPKMTEAAEMTKAAIQNTGISAPLMVMRGDGGAMNIKELAKRPVLAVASGPAAGVAGALLYERVSDGIFIEVGGTSSDISAIKNGRAMIKYSEIGGHLTHVHSLDVRTIGLAGGSLIRISDGRVVDVGPRSAHIASLPYSSFLGPQELEGVKTKTIQPLPKDPSDYVCLLTKEGKRVALTLTCVANALGYVEEGDYAHGNTESAKMALTALARTLGKDAEVVGREIMEKALSKVETVVLQLVNEYKLPLSSVLLVGGGGGASVVVPALAERMKLNSKIAKNNQVISPIGVSLAMVKEMVERTVIDPSEDDILRVKREAEEAAVSSGAVPETVEIFVEVIPEQNIIRAIATGATEIRRADHLQKELSLEDIRAIACESFSGMAGSVKLAAETKDFAVFSAAQSNGFLGFIGARKKELRVVDKRGVIKLRLDRGDVFKLEAKSCCAELDEILRSRARYDEGGAVPPDAFLLVRGKVLDFSGLSVIDHAHSLIAHELRQLADNDQVILIVRRK